MSEPMDIAEACAITDQFGRFLNGLARLQEAAATIRNADQVIAEKRAEADRLHAAIEAAAGELAAINRKITDNQTESQAAIRSLTLAAQQVLEDAKTKAAGIVSAAKEEADGIRKTAADASAQAEAATARLASVKAELAETEQKLQALKDHARKTFGG